MAVCAMCASVPNSTLVRTPFVVTHMERESGAFNSKVFSHSPERQGPTVAKDPEVGGCGKADQRCQGEPVQLSPVCMCHDGCTQ